MYKVLIVDDELFILNGLPHVINWEEHGTEIVARARNGLEALEIMQNHDIHILVTDIMMPAMDGLELIKQIRDRGWNVKIIILSSHDDFKFVKEASKSGIENYLLKPIEEDELSNTILNTVEKLENEANATVQNHDNLNIVRENILYRWVTRNIGYDELENRAEFLQIDLSRESYMVGIVSILKNTKSQSFGISSSVRCRLPFLTFVQKFLTVTRTSYPSTA
ncbi:response regulator [Cohnella herbarum]|uniref:Response regulator n=1 Tax=Cohnella herbarum TaxID=2728023 RepID=A0A7Z2ZNX6_9BACL|nr:response regulator [Cohnella herbarum]QJD86270.1 response regulator [Cohnella herbarum]